MSNIARVLKAYRFHREIGLREMAVIIGLSAPTLCRIEAGKEMSQGTMLKLIQWLFGQEQG